MANSPQQYDYSEFGPSQPSQQYDYSEFTPAQQPGFLYGLGNSLQLPSVIAYLGGASKGAGNLPQALAQRINPNAVNPYDPNTYKNAVAQKISQLMNEHPIADAFGEFTGNVLSQLPLSKFNPFSQASNVARLGNAAAQGAVAVGAMNPNADASDYAIGAATSPLLERAGSIAPNILKRAWNVSFGTNPEDVKNIGSKMYDDLFKEADNANYKTLPINSGLYAKNMLNQIQTGSELGEKLSDPVIDILKTMDKSYDNYLMNPERPNQFSLKDTHNQIRALSDKIGQLYNNGDYTNSKVLAGAKDALVNDIQPSVDFLGTPPLAKKFFDTQNYWKNEVIPLENSPISKKGVIGDLLFAHAMAKLPDPVGVALGAGLGEAGVLPKTSVLNIAKRFASPMKGGQGQVMNSQPMSQYISNYLASQSPYLFGGNNEP